MKLKYTQNGEQYTIDDAISLDIAITEHGYCLDIMVSSQVQDILICPVELSSVRITE